MSPTWTLLALITVSAQGQEPNREDRSTHSPEVRTSASATQTVRPDLATITVELYGQGTTPREAQRLLAIKTDSIRRALATLGIARDSIVNRNRYYWWRGRIEIVPLPVRYVQRRTPTSLSSAPVQDTAYRAHDALQIRVRDLGALGALIDSLVAHGLTNISGVQFSTTSTAAAELAALREATVAARREAETIAEAAGMALGSVIELSTPPYYGYGGDGFQLRSVLSTAGAGDTGGTVVVQPAIPVSVTVYGRWALVRRP